jgi:hypothetical protein
MAQPYGVRNILSFKVASTNFFAVICALKNSKEEQGT